jgi:hypothetical protein
MVFAVAQAMATVVEKGFYSDEPYSFSYDDCGFNVDVEGASSGWSNVNVTTRRSFMSVAKEIQAIGIVQLRR